MSHFVAIYRHFVHTRTADVRLKLGILRTGLGGENDVGSEPAGSVHTFQMALGSKLQGKYTKSNFMIGISSSPSSLCVKIGELTSGWVFAYESS